ncbi:MAG: hypothetical protein ACRELZ_13530 [Candidatus Rokuibacteriota bacterium]
MQDKTIGVVAASLLALGVVGCASGPVTGRVEVTGQSPAPLTMTWESGLFGESGTMAAVMPDGERFSGKYVVVRRGMGRIDPVWEGEERPEARGQIDDSMWGAAQDRVSFVSAHVNKAVATLKGDRGSTMLCRFMLDAPESGLRGGGSGGCQTSKGAKISAQF